jgi:hypothetical protein
MTYDAVESVANYEAVNDYSGQDYARIVPAMVKTWENAPTIELKEAICKSKIVEQVSTTTTLSVFYRLTFEKVAITVLKIFVAAEYDKTKTQENLSVVDDRVLVVGIEPIV